MTVKELRELLAQYPDDMPVSYRCYSEYQVLDADAITTGDLFDNGGYLSRIYRGKDKPAARPYLQFPGN